MITNMIPVSNVSHLQFWSDDISKKYIQLVQMSD